MCGAIYCCCAAAKRADRAARDREAKAQGPEPDRGLGLQSSNYTNHTGPNQHVGMFPSPCHQRNEWTTAWRRSSASSAVPMHMTPRGTNLVAHPAQAIPSQALVPYHGPPQEEAGAMQDPVHASPWQMGFGHPVQHECELGPAQFPSKVKDYSHWKDNVEERNSWPNRGATRDAPPRVRSRPAVPSASCPLRASATRRSIVRDLTGLLRVSNLLPGRRNSRNALQRGAVDAVHSPRHASPQNLEIHARERRFIHERHITRV